MKNNHGEEHSRNSEGLELVSEDELNAVLDLEALRGQST